MEEMDCGTLKLIASRQGAKINLLEKENAELKDKLATAVEVMNKIMGAERKDFYHDSNIMLGKIEKLLEEALKKIEEE